MCWEHDYIQLATFKCSEKEEAEDEAESLRQGQTMYGYKAGHDIWILFQRPSEKSWKGLSRGLILVQ